MHLDAVEDSAYGSFCIFGEEEMKNYIEFIDVKKSYGSGEMQVTALSNVNFDISSDEFVVVLGPSGAGKTTLLNLLGGMDTLTSGKILIEGKDLSSFNKKQLTDYRRSDVGFVFQFYNLMPNLTAIENVELATEICKDALDPQKVLIDVGLKDRTQNFPSQLSGGEQQRVSIARAIAKNPKLLLCDEPTGALDSVTGKNILALLKDVCKKNKKPVIIVTHNQAIKEIADKVIHIKNGKIEEVEINASPKSVEDIEW